MFGNDRLKMWVFVSRGYCIDVKVKSRRQSNPKMVCKLNVYKAQYRTWFGGDSHPVPYSYCTEVFNMYT